MHLFQSFSNSSSCMWKERVASMFLNSGFVMRDGGPRDVGRKSERVKILDARWREASQICLMSSTKKFNYVLTFVGPFLLVGSALEERSSYVGSVEWLGPAIVAGTHSHETSRRNLRRKSPSFEPGPVCMQKRWRQSEIALWTVVQNIY